VKVRVRPVDDSACAYYRVNEPVRVLRETTDLDVETFDGRVWAGSYRDALGVMKQEQPPDVVVIQRPVSRHTAEVLIPDCQAHGVAVVVELDDDFTSISGRNMAFFNTHKQRNPDYNSEWLRKSCHVADLVTCTTPAIAARYAPGHSVVISNYISKAWLDVPHAGDGRTVGWAGSMSVHPDDLFVIGHGLDTTLERAGGLFHAIGDEMTCRALRIDPSRRRLTDWVTAPDYLRKGYPTALAQLDIGLVPLQESAFNRAKSALKMMEYAALGVVPIVSPTPDNTRVRTDFGIGVLAESPRAWLGHIRRLLGSESERQEMSAAGRAAVYDHLTIEGNAWRYAEAWEQAVRNHKRTQGAISGLRGKAESPGVRAGR
jgi:glycosyltransferase involved in cell wall biosynthesis